MENEDRLTSLEKGIGGGCIGGILGGLVATVGTIWGGYEVGTVINDALQVNHAVGRAAIDLCVMSVLAGPAYTVGIWGGVILGGFAGTLYNPVVDTIKDTKKDLGEKVSETYDKMEDEKKE